MRVHGGCTALLCGVVFIMVRAAERSDPVVHRGMCDASAAVAVDRDHFIVANDEDNSLRIYRRDVPSGNPVVSKKLSNYLDVENSHAEADIEGAAAIGDRVYWIASHGASKDGEARPNRRRLFATTVKKDGAEFTIEGVGQPYTSLLKHLADHSDLRDRIDLRAAAKKAPESPGGLNIEGLAATPDGDLLIGLRSPLIDGKAILVPLLNPKKVVDNEDDPRFGAVSFLDLGERGIRSIEYFQERQAYIVVAGPPGSEGSFALFDWSGPSTNRTRSIEVPDWGNLHPEAIFAIAGSIDVLSDDGQLRIGGEQCKDLDESDRRFRRVTVTGGGLP